MELAEPLENPILENNQKDFHNQITNNTLIEDFYKFLENNIVDDKEHSNDLGNLRTQNSYGYCRISSKYPFLEKIYKYAFLTKKINISIPTDSSILLKRFLINSIYSSSYVQPGTFYEEIIKAHIFENNKNALLPYPLELSFFKDWRVYFKYDIIENNNKKQKKNIENENKVKEVKFNESYIHVN